MRKDRLVIGLDVGSSSTKATAFTIDGRLAAQASVAYHPLQAAGGVAEYDAEVLTAAALGALAQLTRSVEGQAVESIAIDAMMSGAVPIDARGRAVGPYTTTLDTRFAPQLDRYVRDNATLLRTETGSAQATLAPKILWLRECRPDLTPCTAKYVLASSLVGGFLAGLDADGHYIDPTYLWTTGLADSRNFRWSPRLLSAAGIDAAWLPEIKPSTGVVGGVCAEVAAATGLRRGTPIVAGCGDQAAGYLGAGITEPGVAADSAGTYAVFAVVSDAFEPSSAPNASDIGCAPTNAMYYYQNIVVGGGLTRQWAAELLGGDEEDASALERRAADVAPGCDGLTFLPYLGGTASPPDASIRGALHGISWQHGPGHVYRAVLEAVALEHAAAVARLGHLGTLRRIIGYGGGSQNHLWNRIKCDVQGVPLETLGRYPVTELGVALLGAAGVGLIDDAARHAQQIVPRGEVLQPDLEQHATYSRVLASYCEIAKKHTDMYARSAQASTDEMRTG